MSAEEMREYCLALSNYKIRVELRLKNVRDVMVGRIVKVDAERFEFLGDDEISQPVRYTWVARIKNA